MNPRSLPNRRNTEVSPHIPGFFRPQFQHTSSLTPTSLPHEGQRVEPVRGRRKSMGQLYQGRTRTDTDDQGPASVQVRVRPCSFVFFFTPAEAALRDRDRGARARPLRAIRRALRLAAAPGAIRRDRPAARCARAGRRALRGRGRGGGRRGPRRDDRARRLLLPGLPRKNRAAFLQSSRPMHAPDSSQWWLQLVWLVVLAIPIACVAWTV